MRDEKDEGEGMWDEEKDEGEGMKDEGKEERMEHEIRELFVQSL